MQCNIDEITVSGGGSPPQKAFSDVMQYGTKLIICNKGICVSAVLLGPSERKAGLPITAAVSGRSGGFADPNTASERLGWKDRSRERM